MFSRNFTVLFLVFETTGILSSISSLHSRMFLTEKKKKFTDARYRYFGLPTELGTCVYVINPTGKRMFIKKNPRFHRRSQQQKLLPSYILYTLSWYVLYPQTPKLLHRYNIHCTSFVFSVTKQWKIPNTDLRNRKLIKAPSFHPTPSNPHWLTSAPFQTPKSRRPAITPISRPLQPEQKAQTSSAGI